MRSVSVSGRSYRYLLHVPDGLARRAPLLLSFHGRGDNPDNHAKGTGWVEFADEERLIVAFPDGEGDWSLERKSAEVQLARAIVGDAAGDYCVNRDRVFASGHSMGGFFAQRLACDAADVFVAVTSYAGGSPDAQDRCVLSRPIAVGLFHGDADAVIPIGAGRESRASWRDRLGCEATPVDDRTDDGASQRYIRCDAGVELQWRQYPEQDHFWPVEPRRSEMLDEMWKFLNRFSGQDGEVQP